MADLERRLSKIPIDAGKLIVTDGIFSTTARWWISRISVGLAKKYKSRVMCDDAHATGVTGVGGRGVASHYNIVDQCDLTMGHIQQNVCKSRRIVVGDTKVIDYISILLRVNFSEVLLLHLCCCIEALQSCGTSRVMTRLLDNPITCVKDSKNLDSKLSRIKVQSSRVVGD